MIDNREKTLPLSQVVHLMGIFFWSSIFIGMLSLSNGSGPWAYKFLFRLFLIPNFSMVF